MRLPRNTRIEYANDRSDLHLAPPPTVQQMYREAFMKYLVYLALYDLRRGWRAIAIGEDAKELILQHRSKDSSTQSLSLIHP